MGEHAQSLTETWKHSETIAHRVRERLMFLPLAMRTEASTMGIMLIDASAEGQHDTVSFKLSTTGNARSECGNTHSYWFVKASRGWRWTNGNEGQYHRAADESHRCVFRNISHDLNVERQSMLHYHASDMCLQQLSDVYMQSECMLVIAEGTFQKTSTSWSAF